MCKRVVLQFNAQKTVVLPDTKIVKIYFSHRMKLHGCTFIKAIYPFSTIFSKKFMSNFFTYFFEGNRPDIVILRTPFSTIFHHFLGPRGKFGQERKITNQYLY